MTLPKRKPIPKDAVIGAHIYIVDVLPPDGGPPDVCTQWRGDLRSLIYMLEMAKKTILDREYEKRGEWE